MKLFDEIYERVTYDLQQSASRATECLGGDPIMGPRCDALDLARSSLLSSLGKKFTGERRGEWPDAELRKARALTKFLNRNKKCSLLNSRFGDGFLGCLSEEHQLIIGESQKWLAAVLAGLDEKLADPGYLIEHIDCGSGVAEEALGWDFYSKAFESPMPFPSVLGCAVWHSLKAHNLSLHNAEYTRAILHGDPFVKHVAKWSSVPKNNETDRSIVIPSNGGGLISRALGKLLEKELDRLGYGIETQPDRNRYLAYLGSLDENQFENWCPCTIDSVEASDSLYYVLIEYLFRPFLPNIWKALVASREPVINVTLGDEETFSIQAEMFSTMGNGFTFPLQTLVYLSFAVALAKVHGAPIAWHDEEGLPMKVIGVFGDDVVVPKAIYYDYISFLLGLGLEPNMDKSYGTGTFRESCGTDWCRGYNVRGVYIQSLDTPHEIVSLFNRLAEWSATWDLPLSTTLSFLWGKIPHKLRNRVPPWEDSCAGICTPQKAVLEPHRISKTMRITLGAVLGSEVYLPWRAIPVKGSLACTFGTEMEQTIYSPSYSIIEDKTGKPVGFPRPKREIFRVANGYGFTLYSVRQQVSGHRVSNPSWVSARYHQTGHVVVHSWDYPPLEIAGVSPDRKILLEDRPVSCRFGPRPFDWSGYLERLTNVLRSVRLTDA